jgi:hypothetical protein
MLVLLRSMKDLGQCSVVGILTHLLFIFEKMYQMYSHLGTSIKPAEFQQIMLKPQMFFLFLFDMYKSFFYASSYRSC